MLPLLLPAGIATLTGISYFLSRRRAKKVLGMTAKRQIIYDHAIRKVKDPVKLRALADAFQSAGLPAQADLLNKRAALRELPQEIKDARSAAYKAGMTMTDPAKIKLLADAFAAQGATGAAASLRDYAAGLIPGSAITTQAPTAATETPFATPEAPLAPTPAPVAPAPTEAPAIVPPEGATTVEGDLVVTISHKENPAPTTIEAEGSST